MKLYITLAKLAKIKLEDGISTYVNNKEAYNIDNKSVIETLNQFQVNGLINQLYRPIDTAVTSNAPLSTPSQSLISPISENHVNDTSDNDSIHKPIPSITRSLPATPMAEIKTTPRVLTIGNSSLNAKFESLESKLCRKIIAMKSYFTDELR